MQIDSNMKEIAVDMYRIITSNQLIQTWLISSIFYYSLYTTIPTFAIAIAMSFFMQADNVWICFGLWEIVSLLSLYLVYSNEYRREFIYIAGISLFSGSAFLCALVGIPFNMTFSAFDLNLFQQIAFICAIAAKSGLFPFLWPPKASYIPAGISGFLHAATVIQLGFHLAYKIGLHKYACMTNSFIILGYITVIWICLNVRKIQDTKKLIACLTQVTLASNLVGLCYEKQFIDVMKSANTAIMGKALIFVLWDRAKNMQLTWFDLIYLCMIIPNIALKYPQITPWNLATVLENLAQGFGMYLSIKFILQIRFKQITKFADWYNGGLWICGLVLPLQSRQTLFLTIAILIYISTQIDWQEIPPIDIDLKKVFSFLSLIALIGFGIYIVIIQLPLVKWSALLQYSFVDLIYAPAFLVGAYFTLTAKNKIEIIAGLNIIGIVIALLFYHKGGPEISSTQLLADLVVTICILRSDLCITSVQTSYKNLLITIGSMISAIIFHPGQHPQLQFSMAKGINQVNEIVVNWRLLDTLGEVLVFFLASLCF